MANLKNKILYALKFGKGTEDVLNDLSFYQTNLLKNYSNPAICNKDKNKILQKYTDLQHLEKSLCRYNSLRENNYIADAKIEERDIEDIIVKDGLTNPRFIWHSENGEHTCEVCKSLDGKVFDYYDEVPERPHPNCKYYVEVIESDKPLPEIDPEMVNEDNTQEKTPSDVSLGWIMPCNGPITSQYGWRIHPIHKTKKFHNGWDIGVPIGTPIKAIAYGKVIAVGPATGYGNWVVIDHGIINGIRVTSEYGHISSWNVVYGQIVNQGQIIAKSGNEGISSGPHLHITIREGSFQGKAEDPSKYIKF